MAVPTFEMGEVAPHEVRHVLDDIWSTLLIGRRKFTARRDDLEQIREARELAQAIAAQAAFWEKDLAAIEAALTQTPDPDEPFGGDDPELDAAVARVAELAEANRDDVERAIEEGEQP
ncbi:hypothetical protein [Thermoactinospora rubra]|uniref:hypothetical protein n=1 Tax=Thermoactinospora rubra TaxID=1088767 RepID=UPI000A0F8D49|nr:hypothetical protein [Thermoactinospora rubra]